MAPTLAGSDSFSEALPSSLSPNYGSLFQQGMRVCVYGIWVPVYTCVCTCLFM